jgi:hypothetical protein
MDGGMETNSVILPMTSGTISTANPVRIEDLEDVSTVSKRIASGLATLEVIAYPWGVELNVRERGAHK